MQFQQQIIETLSALPGVATVGATLCLPLDECDGRTPVYPEGVPFKAGVTLPSVDVGGATSGYFRAMGIPLIEGRTFEPADPGRQQEPPEFLYVSFLGPYSYVAPPHTMTFVVRTETAPLSLARAVRAAVRELDPNVPLANLRTMQEVVDQAGEPTAFAMILLVVAGAVALLLGAVGIYGVLSYIVSPGDPATYAGVGQGLGLVALLASYLPARRAARVDPLDALRSN